jgi:hypothetical protein
MIELVFDRISLRLHTAGDGSLQFKPEPLTAYAIPESDGDVRIEDWSGNADFAPAVGLELAWLQHVMEAGVTCGAILNFAGGYRLWFMNVGDELWSGTDLPPPPSLMA